MQVMTRACQTTTPKVCASISQVSAMLELNILLKNISLWPLFLIWLLSEPVASANFNGLPLAPNNKDAQTKLQTKAHKPNVPAILGSPPKWKSEADDTSSTGDAIHPEKISEMDDSEHSLAKRIGLSIFHGPSCYGLREPCHPLYPAATNCQGPCKPGRTRKACRRLARVGYVCVQVRL